jgi:exonuclease III
VKRTSNLKFGNNSRTILTGNHEDFVPALQVPQNRQTVQERSHVLRKYYEKPKVLQQHAGKLEICIRCINRGSQWNDLNILYPLHSWRYKQTVKWRIITFTFKTNTWIFLQRKGLVFSKRSVPYYNNSMASHHLILSGDIALNPGPDKVEDKNATAVKRNKAPKCPSCEKAVQINHKRFLCEVCYDLFHAKCTGISEYQIKTIRADKHHVWVCSKCTISQLPFYKVSTEEMIEDDLNLNLTQTSASQDSSNLECIFQTKTSHLKIMHLNTQSMVSTFNEFLLTVNSYPLDIIALSETWLKDNPQLMEYVSIPGYATEFRHREDIKGGGVGVYIKEDIKYKRRLDIEKLHPELEHLWLEVPGRNIHSKALVGVMYRSIRMLSTAKWLESLESLLSQLTVTWDGMLILTGDMNIDMLQAENSLTKQYQCILDVFGLHQVIEKPTRVTKASKTLIDHLITNFPCTKDC